MQVGPYPLPPTSWAWLGLFMSVRLAISLCVLIHFPAPSGPNRGNARSRGHPLTPAFLSEGSFPDVKVPCQPGTTVFTPTSGSLELLVQWGVGPPACGQGCQVGLAVEGIHLPGTPLTPVPGRDSPIRFPLQVSRSGSVAGVGEPC